jgi:phage repressor protein C with HTH and peptisase S24 domain
MRIWEVIRHIIETKPGLTQRGLAERMGLNPAAVNRMLYGQRKIMAEEIPIIEDYIGEKLDLHYPQERQGSAKRGFNEAPGKEPGADRVPVYGYAAGSGELGGKGGLNLANGEVIDWVARHPAQIGIGNAFAVYIVSDSMEPRYFRGELVYVHPGRPPDANRDCVIEMQNGDAFIKRLLRHGGDRIRVQQYNPAEEKEIMLSNIKAIYPVIGRG